MRALRQRVCERVLGMIGEYLGRMYLKVNQRPQSVVREVVRKGAV